MSLSALFLAACTSVSRQSTTAAPPWWETDTEAPVDGVTVEADLGDGGASDGAMAAASQLSAPADDELADAAADSLVELSPEAAAARHKAYAARTDADRKRVRQVNEYVHWCLQRSMWDEAQIHLERALATDSLAASLHNNLGIVLERRGRRDEARQRYRLAANLNPRRPLYEANLKRLQNALRDPKPQRRDTTVTDGLLLPGPVEEYSPRIGATLIRSEDEAQSALP